MVVRPSSGPTIGQADIEQAISEPFIYVSDYTKKKIRNLEKRKAKLESYKAKLKSGEPISKDQQTAVNKMDEVLGMLSFANDIVSHLSQVEVILKKEKKKRLRREQLQSDAEKLEGLTRQIELYTLMHLTADELVGPLREECSFLPSPGASLNQFASGTAKHLISLTDPQDKTEPVNYQQIKEKLEEIEPSFNPVPDFEEYEMEEDVGEDDEPVAEPADVPKVENGDAEQQESEPLDDQVENDEEEVVEEIEIVQNEVEVVLEEKVEENGVDIVDEEPIVIAQEPEISENNVAISETLEFVNRDVLYKEEDQIKEILTEVSSQFNFMAPAAGESDCDESDVEPPINNELSFIPTPANATQSDQPPMENLVTGGDQLNGEFINTKMHYNEQMESPERHQVSPPKPVSQHIPDSRAPPNNHHPNQYDDSVKDELNWQQRAQAAPSGGGGGPGRPGSFNRSSQGGYKNSNRYRQFNDRNNRQNGDGPRGGGTGHYNGYGNGDRRRRGGGGPRKPE